jgi:hypothetical protein
VSRLPREPFLSVLIGKGGEGTEGSSWKSWQVWFWQRPLSVLCLAMVFEKQSRSGAAQKRDDVGKTFETQNQLKRP